MLLRQFSAVFGLVFVVSGCASLFGEPWPVTGVLEEPVVVERDMALEEIFATGVHRDQIGGGCHAVVRWRTSGGETAAKWTMPVAPIEVRDAAASLLDIEGCAPLRLLLLPGFHVWERSGAGEWKREPRKMCGPGLMC